MFESSLRFQGFLVEFALYWVCWSLILSIPLMAYALIFKMKKKQRAFAIALGAIAALSFVTAAVNAVQSVPSSREAEKHRRQRELLENIDKLPKQRLPGE